MGRGAEERGGDSAGVQPQDYEGTHPHPRALGQGRVQGAEGGTWGRPSVCRRAGAVEDEPKGQAGASRQGP